MSVYCKELNKSFENKESLFKGLYENENEILNVKKTTVYKSYEKGLAVISSQKNIEKSFESVKGMKFDSDYYYFVVNSSNILDSHNDMHVEGNWKKTIKEQQGKVYLVFDHNLKRSEIIAMRKDIEILTANIPFSLLNKDYEGDSYCLIYKVKKDRLVNKEAKEWLEAGHELEASVRMQYVQIFSCYNSTNPDYAKQKENFDAYYKLIANKDDFEEINYFYVVKEAKNVQESSLVLFGSNSATGLINEENKEEPRNHSDQIEPLKNTQKENELLKELLNKF